MRRILSELRGHVHDLRTDAVARGMNDAEATTWASSRLGTEQRVAKETLARPELRSWSARWPWAIYAILPPFLMAALVVLVVLAMGPAIELYALNWEWEPSGANLPHFWFMSAVDGIRIAANLLLTLAPYLYWLLSHRETRSELP